MVLYAASKAFSNIPASLTFIFRRAPTPPTKSILIVPSKEFSGRTATSHCPPLFAAAKEVPAATAAATTTIARTACATVPELDEEELPSPDDPPADPAAAPDAAPEPTELAAFCAACIAIC